MIRAAKATQKHWKGSSAKERLLKRRLFKLAGQRANFSFWTLVEVAKKVNKLSSLAPDGLVGWLSLSLSRFLSCSCRLNCIIFTHKLRRERKASKPFRFIELVQPFATRNSFTCNCQRPLVANFLPNSSLATTFQALELATRESEQGKRESLVG